MEKIIEILMRRDDMNRKEAAEVVKEARKALMEAAADGDMEAAEEVLYDQLGLELDYLFDLIGF